MEGKALYEEKLHGLLFQMVFRIYHNKIEVIFWPFKYTIPFHDVKGVEIVDRVPLLIGWGLRMNPFTRTLYFVYHHGRCIVIKKKSGFWRKILLSVKNSGKFLNLLKSQTILKNI